MVATFLSCSPDYDQGVPDINDKDRSEKNDRLTYTACIASDAR